MVRDLLLGFVPQSWLAGLDIKTLEKVSGNYVSDDLRDREDDIVWRVHTSTIGCAEVRSASFI